jgi:hypothetical protein
MNDEPDRCKFPVPTNHFPVRAKNFPVPKRAGNLPQHIRIAVRIGAGGAENGPDEAEIRKIP